jgi:hypothetical protein
VGGDGWAAGYRSLDRERARAIRDVLEGAGYNTIFQTIKMQEGNPAASIAKAFQDSRVLLACVTRNYPMSIWTNQEFWRRPQETSSSSCSSRSRPGSAGGSGRSYLSCGAQNPVVQRKLLLDAAEYFVS